MKHIIKYNKGLSKTVVIKTLLSGAVIFYFALSAFAQTTEAVKANDKAGVFSNALFLTLLAIVVLLLIILAVLGGVLKNIAEYYAKNSNNKKANWLGVLIPLLFFVSSSYAQGNNIQNISSGIGGLDMTTFNVLVGAILLELIIITVLLVSINTIIRTAKPEKTEEVEKIAEESSFLERINASVAIEKEEEIMLDHNYDGIRELDNDLPPWWKYGFYLTIIIGVIYLINYHVLKTGDLQVAEYKKEVAAAEQKMEENRRKSTNIVDETNVKMLTDAGSIAKGKEIFTSICFACHGKLGEGGVGPNLTDDYWLHGGSIKDIFKTIKYGYPEKGMKSWKEEFSPQQINQIASYVKTLKGTNPPNGKEKQGVLYEEETITAVKPDSLAKK